MVRCTTAGTTRDCKQPPSPTPANRWQLDAHGAGHVASVQICILPTTEPIKVPSGRSFVLWGRNEAQHSLGGDALASGCAYSSFLPLLTGRQTDRRDHLALPTGRNMPGLLRLRVTQRMHVLSSFLASCLLRTPTVLYSPLWGTEIQGGGMWRPTYMKSCFSDGGCSCSLATFFFVPMSVWLLTIRLGAAEFSMLRKRFWCLEQAEDSGEGTRAARHREHASQASADRCIRQLQW